MWAFIPGWYRGVYIRWGYQLGKPRTAIPDFKKKQCSHSSYIIDFVFLHCSAAPTVSTLAAGLSESLPLNFFSNRAFESITTKNTFNWADANTCKLTESESLHCCWLGKNEVFKYLLKETMPRALHWKQRALSYGKEQNTKIFLIPIHPTLLDIISTGSCVMSAFVSLVWCNDFFQPNFKRISYSHLKNAFIVFHWASWSFANFQCFYWLFILLECFAEWSD